MRERLNVTPSTIVSKYLFQPSILDDSNRSFQNMLKINLAHVLMLYRQSIIGAEDTCNLLKATLKLKTEGPDALELNPEYEDLYFNIEKYIVSKTGLETGGKMHTGRSRNDLYSTVTRMNVRDAAISLYKPFLELEYILLNLAKQHTTTVITGYTHMQPAQPITFAHYIISICQALERDFQRFDGAYKRLNICPLGSGAFAGTSFNIDREYTAKVLGFDGVLDNSMDAVASRDYVLEILSHLAILGSTLSRFANDLYIWSTDEFRFIEVDDSVAASSSIMPQKKNPVTLEHIKSKTSHLLGSFVSVFCSMKNIPYGHSRDLSSESIHLFWDAAGQMEAIFELLNITLKTMKVKSDSMEKRVNANFCTVTDLADELVKKEGISFRIAHSIVGSIVKECLENGLSTLDITAEMLDRKAIEFGQRELNWNKEEIGSILNAKESIFRKASQGSPSPKESERLINSLYSNLNDSLLSYNEKVENLSKADSLLNEEINNLLKG